MGAIQFIESLDRTTLTISDSEFESNVETAVFAIAERHTKETPLSVRRSYPQMPASSDTEMLSQSATDPDSMVVRSSGLSVADKRSDSSIAVNGILPIIQKPLISMGSIFPDETPTSLPSTEGDRSGDQPHLGSRPLTGLYQAAFQPPRNSYDGRRAPDVKRATPDTNPALTSSLSSDATMIRQASSDMAHVQQLQRDEHDDVVE